MRIHCLENVDKALQFLKEQRVHLENMGSHDIVDGNPRLSLGLIWTIILRFQVSVVYNVYLKKKTYSSLYIVIVAVLFDFENKISCGLMCLIFPLEKLCEMVKKEKEYAMKINITSE